MSLCVTLPYAQGWTFVRKNGESVTFGPGANNVYDEDLINEILEHPMTEAMESEKIIGLSGAVVEGRAHNTGFVLADLKDVELDGAPVAIIDPKDKSSKGKPQYQKSGNTSGLKKTREPSKGTAQVSNLPPEKREDKINLGGEASSNLTVED
jgi:hypothetical protein